MPVRGDVWPVEGRAGVALTTVGRSVDLPGTGSSQQPVCGTGSMHDVAAMVHGSARSLFVPPVIITCGVGVRCMRVCGAACVCVVCCVCVCGGVNSTT